MESSWNEDNVNQELNVPITKSEVSVVLANTKNGKAQGLDGVVAVTLRNRPSIDVLTALFNFCLEHGITLSVWSKGIISPIPKNASGDPRIPMNYRGISLLPVIAKVYSACISNRLSKHLEENGMLCNEQNGFRPEQSLPNYIIT